VKSIRYGRKRRQRIILCAVAGTILLCGAAAAVTVIYMYKSIEKQKISKGEEIIMEDKTS